MTTVRDNQADIERGRKAEAELLEVGGAFDAVEAALMRTLLETGVGADAKILKLHMSLQNLSAVREAIFRVVKAGREGHAYELAAREAIAEQGLTRP